MKAVIEGNSWPCETADEGLDFLRARNGLTELHTILVPNYGPSGEMEFSLWVYADEQTALDDESGYDVLGVIEPVPEDTDSDG